MVDDTMPLAIAEPKTPAPRVKPEEVVGLARVLRKAGGWVTKAEIAALLGVPCSESFRRRLRAIAEVGAPTIVSWPGSPGLKHWSHVTVEEIDHAVAAHESQAKQQLKRAHVFRLAKHRGFRAPIEPDGQEKLAISDGSESS